MPRKSGLKRKKIEAGDPPFIPEGKPPEPADNSAAGSFLKCGLSVLDPLTARAPTARPRQACSLREGALRLLLSAML
jgi:hypothetical protein